MPKGVRVFVVVLVLVSAALAALVATRFVSLVSIWHRGQATVIRRPDARPPATPIPAPGAQNIAPLATVTVSSTAAAAGELDGGVADGVLDGHEWVAGEGLTGAWIKLSWHVPATITEIALYDRPGRFDNVLSGTLSFDDGSLIPVPALPRTGIPWRTAFPPKTVQWVMFRIDRAEGKNTGLAEFMVFGSLNR